MSKGYDEITTEILTALIAARGEAAKSPSANVQQVNFIVSEYLSDAAIAKAYKTIYNTVIEAHIGK